MPDIYRARTLLSGLVLLLGAAPFFAIADTWRTAEPPEANMLDRPLVELLSKHFGAELSSVEAPFARRLRMIQEGRIDILAGLLKRGEREASIYFLDPPYKLKSNKHFFVRRGDSRKVRVYEDLYGLEVGVSIGSRTFPRFEQDSAIKKIKVSSLEQKFMMLLYGRLDTFIHTDIEALAYMQQAGLSDQVEIAEYRYTQINPVHIGISRQSPLMAQQQAIEAEYRRMAASGELDRFIVDFFQSRQLPVPDYK